MTKKTNYEVGYGRPPKETQFQKGMIANPNGARGKKRNKPLDDDLKAAMADMYRRLISEKQRVTIDGQPQSITRLEVILRRLLNEAMAGDLKALREMRIWQETFPEIMQIPIRPNGNIIFLYRAASPAVIKDISLEMFVETFGTVSEADRVVIGKYFPSRPDSGFMPEYLKQKS
jgi:hypothetical protein